MSNHSLQQIAEICARNLMAEDHATKGLNMTLASVGPGRATLTMRIEQSMTNGHGSCHGGYLFTLADSAFAFACNSHGPRSVAQNCTIAYVAPGKLGMLLTAEGVERQRGERSGITDVTVRDETGAIIAEFRGHSRVVPGAPLYNPDVD
jgi:acyl-CoA thioesterase